MKTSPVLSAAPSQPREGPLAVLSALIAYDTLAAEQNAFHVLSNIVADHQHEFDFQARPWRFDLLADPDWRNLAAVEAIDVDLLIISTATAPVLPQSIRTWLTACTARKQNRSGALVALLGPPPGSGPSASDLEFLREAATDAGLEFFAASHRREKCPAADPGMRIPAGGFEMLPRFTPDCHWGINE